MFLGQCDVADSARSKKDSLTSATLGFSESKMAEVSELRSRNHFESNCTNRVACEGKRAIFCFDWTFGRGDEASEANGSLRWRRFSVRRLCLRQRETRLSLSRTFVSSPVRCGGDLPLPRGSFRSHRKRPTHSATPCYFLSERPVRPSGADASSRTSGQRRDLVYGPSGCSTVTRGVYEL